MPVVIDHTPPKVSIILTTYNGAKYIGETIDSILNQTYDCWELIIIDDGSDDDTVKIIQGFNDHRIQLQHAGRIGVNGKIKNTGLNKASGELIAFIDHDDLWAPSKLEKQVAALQQYAEAGFCLTGGYNFKIKEQPLEYFYKKKEGIRVDNIFTSFFQSELPGYTQALMLRKECIQIAGTFKEDKLFSDTEFILDLASHFKAIVLYEPLFFRRLHPSNSNQLSWEKNFYQGMGIIQSYKKNLPRKLARDALFNVYLNFGETCLSNGMKTKAVFQFLKAWTYHPFRIVIARKLLKALMHVLKK